MTIANMKVKSWRRRNPRRWALRCGDWFGDWERRLTVSEMKSAIVPWHITDTFSFAAMDSAPPDHIAIVLWNTSDMILGTARSRTIESLLIKNLSLLGRTSEVSHAHWAVG